MPTCRRPAPQNRLSWQCFVTEVHQIVSRRCAIQIYVYFTLLYKNSPTALSRLWTKVHHIWEHVGESL